VKDGSIYAAVSAESILYGGEPPVQSFGPGIIAAESRDDSAFADVISQYEPNPSPPFSFINMLAYARTYVIDIDGNAVTISSDSQAYSSVTSYFEIFSTSDSNSRPVELNVQGEIKEIFSGEHIDGGGLAIWSLTVGATDGVNFIEEPLIDEREEDRSTTVTKFDESLTFRTNTLYQVKSTLYFGTGAMEGFNEISGFFDPTFALVTPDPDLELVQSRPLLGTPVPEPSSWAMMLMGFAGLGYVGYQSRRTRLPPDIASASTRRFGESAC
jgi:hypothetical protein